MVSAPPVGCHPQGFWAEVECAFLNTYQARWQYVADTLGLGFAQGKTLFWRRADLEAAGGIAHARRRSGGRRRHRPSSCAPPAARCASSMRRSSSRSARARCADVWNRQVRWARLRRDSFPAFYLPGDRRRRCAAAGRRRRSSLSPPAIPVARRAAAFLRALVRRGNAAGRRRRLASARSLYPLHAILRDLMLPVLWVKGWRGRGFVWRGNAMSVDEAPTEKADAHTSRRMLTANDIALVRASFANVLPIKDVAADLFYSAPVRDRAAAARDVSGGSDRAEEEADGDDRRRGRRTARPRHARAARQGARGAPCRLRRHSRALRASSASADVDAGARLGDAFTPDVRSPGRKVYGVLAGAMQAGAAEVAEMRAA